VTRLQVSLLGLGQRSAPIARLLLSGMGSLTGHRSVTGR